MTPPPIAIFPPQCTFIMLILPLPTHLPLPPLSFASVSSPFSFTFQFPFFFSHTFLVCLAFQSLPSFLESVFAPLTFSVAFLLPSVDSKPHILLSLSSKWPVSLALYPYLSFFRHLSFHHRIPFYFFILLTVWVLYSPGSYDIVRLFFFFFPLPPPVVYRIPPPR